MLTMSQKNALSHRGNAVRQWAEWIKLNEEELEARERGEVRRTDKDGHKGFSFMKDGGERWEGPASFVVKN